MFSPDSRRVAALGEGSVATIWHVEKGQVLKTLKGHAEIIERSAFDRKGELVATADATGTVKVWTAGPGREVMEEAAWVHGVAYSPDGRLIAAAPFGGGLVIHDAESGRHRLSIKPHHEWFVRMAFSPDGRRLAAIGSHNAVKVYDVQTGELRLRLVGHTQQCFGIAYTPDGARLATVGLDSTARIWDAHNGQPLSCLERGVGALYGVEFLGTDRMIVWGDAPNTRIWDLNSMVCVRELPGQPDGPWALAVSHDGRFIATRHSGGMVFLWDAASGRVLRRWESRGYRGQMTFTPDDRRLVAITSRHGFYGYEIGMIELWDTATGRQVLMLEKHVDAGGSLAFNPDGHRLCTSASDFAIRQTEAFPWVLSANSQSAAQADELRTYAAHYWEQRLKAERGTNAEYLAEGRIIESPLDMSLIPERDSRGTPMQIDLTRHFTDPLTEVFHPVFRAIECLDHDLRELPRGLVELGGKLFDVRGVIQLRPGEQRTAWELNWSLFQAACNGIPVGSFERIHLVHGGILWPLGSADLEGRPVAALVFHYADGERSEVEIVYGRQVREWETNPGSRSEVSEGEVVWWGSNPVVALAGDSLRLYQASWDNPRPGERVASIDFVSRLTAFAPFLIAITVE